MSDSTPTGRQRLAEIIARQDTARGRPLTAREQLENLAAALADVPDECEWRLDDPDQGTWETSCGQAFTIIEGSPTQNDMRFCCYCGDPLKETVSGNQ